MINSKVNEGMRFEEFVLSVIRQKCVNQSKPFFAGDFDFADRRSMLYHEKIQHITFMEKPFFGVGYRYDGYAPDGFDGFDMPVIIEVKYNPRNIRDIIYNPLTDDESCISLYIISTNEKEAREKIRGKRVVVWGRETIAGWEKQYPVDFYAYTDRTPEELEREGNLPDFEQKNQSNKMLLNRRIVERNISLSLGAGVSMEHGAKCWGKLIDEFYKELCTTGRIDSDYEVQKKIGGTSIINGQFAQDNLQDFMGSLYKKGLYSLPPALRPAHGTSLHSIVKLASRLCQNPKFNIITYNYDNFLEQLLTAAGVQFKTIYRRKDMLTGNSGLCVYHPHGYLPENASAINFPHYRKYIVFGESEYHKLYNSPRSWANALQRSLYQNSIYLFVGCSLTDPNLRRILEKTKTKARTHFALMDKDKLTRKDQFTVHKHFMRIGVECIWFNSLVDLQIALATWASGGSVQ